MLSKFVNIENLMSDGLGFVLMALQRERSHQQKWWNIMREDQTDYIIVRLLMVNQ